MMKTFQLYTLFFSLLTFSLNAFQEEHNLPPEYTHETISLSDWESLEIKGENVNQANNENASSIMATIEGMPSALILRCCGQYF